MVGTITTVWMSPSFLKSDNLKCAQMHLAKDAISARDTSYLKDNTSTNSVDYNFILERPGRITLTSPETPDDWQYIVYINNKQKVYEFLQCVPKRDCYQTKMMLLNVYLLLVVTCCCVHGLCNKTIISNIQGFWGKRPPRVELQKLVGTITVVWISPSFFSGDNLKCFQTDLEKDAMSATDITYKKDNTQFKTEYDVILERPGTITLTSPGTPDDWQYIVYLNNREKVYGYHQCVPTTTNYEPFVGVAVVNYNKNSQATAKAIKEAKAVLEKLGINNGAQLPTDCPSFRRY